MVIFILKYKISQLVLLCCMDFLTLFFLYLIFFTRHVFLTFTLRLLSAMMTYITAWTPFFSLYMTLVVTHVMPMELVQET